MSSMVPQTSCGPAGPRPPTRTRPRPNPKRPTRPPALRTARSGRPGTDAAARRCTQSTAGAALQARALGLPAPASRHQPRSQHRPGGAPDHVNDVGRARPHVVNRRPMLHACRHINASPRTGPAPCTGNRVLRHVERPPRRREECPAERLAIAPRGEGNGIRRMLRAFGRAPSELDPVRERLSRDDAPRVGPARPVRRRRLGVHLQRDD